MTTTMTTPISFCARTSFRRYCGDNVAVERRSNVRYGALLRKTFDIHRLTTETRRKLFYYGPALLYSARRRFGPLRSRRLPFS